MLDRRHIERLDQANVIHFKMPLVRHGIGMFMQDAGVLAPFVEGALAGTLSAADCQRLARNRRGTTRYFEGMGTRARSVQVKAFCMRRMMQSERIISAAQDDFNQIFRAVRDWDVLDDPAARDWPMQFDDGKLFFCLEGVTDAGRHETAVAIRRMAMARRKVGAKLLSLIAESAWKLGHMQEAEAYGRLACQTEPGNGNAHRILSGILLSGKRLDQATEIAREGVAPEPGSFFGWSD